MRYFDTDVLVNAIIIQDEKKHEQSIDLITEAIESDRLFISLLVMQELAFVLSKLGCDKKFIKKNLDFFSDFAIINYDVDNFTRAIHIADEVSYSNINDCLHTAIAEKYCNELITYNKKDYKRISALAGVKIVIL
jgi:predicted nucleic acid-binding protein